MLMSLVLAAFGFAPPAQAAFEIDPAEFYEHARPLIDAFVAQQAAAYQTAFDWNDATWASKTPIYRTHALGLPFFNGGRWDSSCRDISVELNGFGRARAHFYVNVSFPQNKIIAYPRGENPLYELVATCNRLKGSIKPEMVIDGVAKDRTFSDEELVAQGTPLIQALLRANHKSEALDASSFELRRKGVDLDDNRGPFGWLYLKVGPRNVACRRVRVYVPEENAVLTTYLSVLYNHDDFAPHIPADQQSILMDQKTFRPYRFSLVKGCDAGGFFEPASPHLSPVKVKPAPKTEPAAPATPVS